MIILAYFLTNNVVSFINSSLLCPRTFTGSKIPNPLIKFNTLELLNQTTYRGALVFI